VLVKFLLALIRLADRSDRLMPHVRDPRDGGKQ
jgi:hypothetical protein